jgi:hypothetical protein
VKANTFDAKAQRRKGKPDGDFLESEDAFKDPSVILIELAFFSRSYFASLRLCVKV